MTQGPETQERLDAIQHLLERERLFRVVSARTALVAGTLSLLASTFLLWRLASTGSRVIDMGLFVGTWLAILVVTLLVGGSLLCRGTRGGASAFPSPALRLVGETVTPFVVTAIALGLLLSWRGDAYSLSITWVTLYGLALLSLSHFTPRSIATLGWSFLIVGVSLMLFVYLRIRLLIGYERSDAQSALLMGATFGILHVLYAVVSWAQIHREEQAACKN